MLNQNINFFKFFADTLAQPRSVLDWQSFVKIISFVVILSLGLALYTGFDIYRLNKKRETIKVQIAELQNKFVALKKAYPESFFAKDTATSIQDLQKNIALEENALATIINSSKFSEILKAFSRTAVPNLWITGLKIVDNAKVIVVTGKSMQANYINTYYQQLERDQAFDPYKINLSHVTDISQTPNQNDVDFEITMTKGQ